MDRRRFLRSTALSTAAAYLPELSRNAESQNLHSLDSSVVPVASVDVEEQAFICEFSLKSTRWKVYEDLRMREGAITFVSSVGAHALTKSAEASFAEDGPAYLGLTLKDIGTSLHDLLAERLLGGGDDPDPGRVKAAAPPLGSASLLARVGACHGTRSSERKSVSIRCQSLPAGTQGPTIPCSIFLSRARNRIRKRQ
jgi:hypothetical protein